VLTDVFDEEGVKALLGGDDRSVAAALEAIARHLRDGLCAWLRRSFPGLSPEDLADVWQETLVGVLRAVREERLDLARPLVPWLCKVASRRAVDIMRRSATNESALAAVGERLSRSDSGARWSALSGDERREALELTLDHIRRLPAMQRAVLQVFSDHYPVTACMEVLRRRVGERLGRDVTLASVKRALQEGRRKLRDHLVQKGFRRVL